MKKNIFQNLIQIKLANLIALIILMLAFASIVLSIKYTNKEFLDDDGILWSLSMGFVPGLILLLAQFFISWYEFQTIEKFKKLGIINILSHRDGSDYYGEIINKASEKIWVLGETASRFMNDFCDIESENTKKRLIIKKLEKGIKVRVLVPNKKFIEEKKYPQFDSAINSFRKIQKEYNNFEYRYFDKNPIASFVLVDSDLVVGPILPQVESKNTPTLHIESTSVYAQSYINYFETLWGSAK